MSEPKIEDVNDIVADYLTKNGYDGLFSFSECACLIDDLAPCGDIQGDCIPGYRGPCGCGDHAFHICSSRAEVEAEKEAMR